MPNPKLETYKNKATNTVYDLTDADAQSKLTAILDGTDIDSFGDVETALADKANASDLNAILDGTNIDSFADVESALDGKADLVNNKIPSAQLPTATSDSIGAIAVGSDFTLYGGVLQPMYQMLHSGYSGIADADEVSDAIDDVYKSNGVLGAKNINGTRYYTDSKFTVNADKSITVNGTFSSQTVNPTSSAAGSFKAPFTAQMNLKGGYSGSCYLFPYDVTDSARPYKDSTKTSRLTTDEESYAYGSHVVTFYMIEGHEYAINLRVSASTTLDNVSVKPLLWLASDFDDSFVPYAMTNKELTDAVTPVDYTPTYSGNFAANSATSVEYKMVGALKVISAYIKGDTVTADTWTTLCTLPADMKPSTGGEIQLYGKVNGGIVVDCNVSSAGAIRIKSPSALAATDIIKVSGVYI